MRSEKDTLLRIEALINNNIINAKGLLDMLSRISSRAFFLRFYGQSGKSCEYNGREVRKSWKRWLCLIPTKYPVTTARFANVAFSNGSLPAGFLERISKKSATFCT